MKTEMKTFHSRNLFKSQGFPRKRNPSRYNLAKINHEPRKNS